MDSICEFISNSLSQTFLMFFHCRMECCAAKAVSAISLRRESSETQDRATPKRRRQGEKEIGRKRSYRCHLKSDRRPVYTHFDVYACGFIDRVNSGGLGLREVGALA